MQWTMFQQTLDEIERRWKTIKLDFPDYKEYLKKCGLVITYHGTQHEFKKNLDVYDLHQYMPLVQSSAMKDGLASFFELLKKVMEETAKNRDPKEDARLGKIIQGLRADIDYFPVECLEIHDDFSVEIVFPTLVFGLTQALKSHPLVNAEKTCQCTACIRVYLY